MTANVRDREKLRMKPLPQKRWSHQDELTALKGKPVLLSLARSVAGHRAGQRVVVLEADQFALKVQLDDGRALVVFKHDIDGFEVTE